MRFAKSIIKSAAVAGLLCGFVYAEPSTQPASTQPAGVLLTSWEGSMDGWRIFVEDVPGGLPEAKGVAFSTIGATDGKQSLAVQMKDGFRKSLRTDDLTYASRIKGHKLSIDVTVPADAAAGSFLQVSVAAVAEGMTWQMPTPQMVAQDGQPHTVILDTSKWPIPDHPQYFGLWIINNTADGTKTGTIYFDNLRIVD